MTGAKPSVRLTDDEAWDFVTAAHTGILTTLRRDGMPIATPLWFASVEQRIYARTRGKKLRRLARDPRGSFLVESGDHWSELQAVHLTGTASLLDPVADAAAIATAETELGRKYEAFRASTLPAATAERYGSTMQWLRFTPDDRVVSWSNAKLLRTSGPPARDGGTA